MKQFIFFYFVLVFLILTGMWEYNKILDYNTKTNLYTNKNGISYLAKTSNKDFLIHTNKKWHSIFLKGVNMGVAKPGYFPGEFGITKKDYLRWFKDIYEMNANVIRVYTLQSPAFYEALYEFNLHKTKPLYIIHGVWVNEIDIATNMDALADNHYIEKSFINDAKEIVDAIHGNITVKPEDGYASGKYSHNISQYVVAWILGIEFSADFVVGTNDNNKKLTFYNGEYLYTSENASPFECFLTKVADNVIIYETDKYKMQRPTAVSNWLTTDPLSHPNEPNPNMEDRVSVDVEHILARKSFEPGLFASYHIYPYYPDFLNYDLKYASGDITKINTYKAYLKELINYHTIPVLVAEFGVPSSRGISHESKYSKYNQGHINERQQGTIVSSLIDDIKSEGYMGSIVFSWQDEWFKRSWNTVDSELSDRRAYWLNPQTGEKNFGLLAFDPGEEESACYVDGNTSEWTDEDIILTNNDNYSLAVKSDEAYLYLKINTKNYDFNKDTLIVPIDTIKDQGNFNYKDFNFNRGTDFLLVINGKENTELFVDSYYDWFYYTYAIYLNEPLIARNESYEVKNTGIFNSIYMALDRGWYLPQTKVTTPFEKFNTGKLEYGNANPTSKNYNSLADFYHKNGQIEVRIPWGLISVMDPSSKKIIDDLYTQEGIKPTSIDKFYFGLTNLNSTTKTIAMNGYSWKKWTMPTYHERLKDSYYILKDKFATIK